MLCRFEDRIAGRALALEGWRARILARHPGELEQAFADIEAARQRGEWVALLLDYELGAWFEPEAFGGAGADRSGSTAVGSTGAVSGISPASKQSARPRAEKDADGRADQDAGAKPLLTALTFAEARESTPWPAPAGGAAFDLQARALMRRQDYLEAIRTLRAAIANGEIYQANYTFPLALQTSMAPRELYCALAARHPVAHAAYIEDGRRSVLSLSPELFFERRGDTITVRPMKGTAPRHADPARDRESGERLRMSEKDRAENVMIVDLLRNDLGRLATPGSVSVDALFTLEGYPSVWQLTSTISARAPQAPLASLLRALFPCGSITGAPKIAAMKKIHALELGPRGIYCGSVGWLAPNGDCRLNVAIRTIEMPADRPGSGIMGVGGGIVHDSDPAREWEECLWKARVLGRDANAPAPVAFEH